MTFGLRGPLLTHQCYVITSAACAQRKLTSLILPPHGAPEGQARWEDTVSPRMFVRVSLPPWVCAQGGGGTRGRGQGLGGSRVIL